MAGSAKNMLLLSLGMLLVGTGTVLRADDTKTKKVEKVEDKSKAAKSDEGVPSEATKPSEDMQVEALKNEGEAPKSNAVENVAETTKPSTEEGWCASCYNGVCNRTNGAVDFMYGNPVKTVFMFIGMAKVVQWINNVFDFCTADDTSVRRRRRVESIPSALGSMQ